MERFFGIVPRERLYELTGIQFLPFNSLFQLQALRENNTALLGRRRPLPDDARSLHLFPVGRPRSTKRPSPPPPSSSIPAARTGRPISSTRWGSGPPCSAPRSIPDTVVGTLLPGPAKETGLPQIPVVAAASHDTASAVAAVPAHGRGLGLHQLGHVVAHGRRSRGPDHQRRDAAAELHQRRRRRTGPSASSRTSPGCGSSSNAARNGTPSAPLSYEEMRGPGRIAPRPFGAFIDPDAPDFLNPADMPAAIRSFCRRTGQTPPQTPAEIIRCASRAWPSNTARSSTICGASRPGPSERST